MEKFVEDKRGNIHSAGGSSGTNYKTKGKSDSDSAENGTKEYVVGKIIISENTVADFKEKRIAERAENCSHCKSFSKNKISEAKHYHIKNENKSGNRNMEEIFDYKRNTGCSAKGDSGRKDKKLDAQRIDYISENDPEKRGNLLPDIFYFIHFNSPFKSAVRITKKRLPSVFPDKRF